MNEGLVAAPQPARSRRPRHVRPGVDAIDLVKKDLELFARDVLCNEAAAKRRDFERARREESVKASLMHSAFCILRGSADDE